MRHRWNIWFYQLIEYLGLYDMVKMDSSTNSARRERLFRNIHKNDSLTNNEYNSLFIIFEMKQILM